MVTANIIVKTVVHIRFHGIRYLHVKPRALAWQNVLTVAPKEPEKHSIFCDTYTEEDVVVHRSTKIDLGSCISTDYFNKRELLNLKRIPFQRGQKHQIPTITATAVRKFGTISNNNCDTGTLRTLSNAHMEKFNIGRREYSLSNPRPPRNKEKLALKRQTLLEAKLKSRSRKGHAKEVRVASNEERDTLEARENPTMQDIFPFVGSIHKYGPRSKLEAFGDPQNAFEELYNSMKNESDDISKKIKGISKQEYKIWWSSVTGKEEPTFEDHYKQIIRSLEVFMNAQYPNLLHHELFIFRVNRCRTLGQDKEPLPMPRTFREFRDVCSLSSTFVVSKKAIFRGFKFASRGNIPMEEIHAIAVTGLFKEFVMNGIRPAIDKEEYSLNSLNKRKDIFGLYSPAKQYPKAREICRKIILHIGPTNSGKTYNALQAFQKAESGFYAGPLRLLAREVYNHMKAVKKPCNLVTGEEVVEEFDSDGQPAKLSSGTVEMMNIFKDLDVAVIDEIQMIGNPERGWAWTQAFLGVRAKEVHVCGDANSEFLIKTLVAETGDTLEIKRYNRLGKLTLDYNEPVVGLGNLKHGDCLVFFSKMQLLATKAAIENHTGEKCAIIYGQLPAEIRSMQAAEFNNPNSKYKYLVASDAIGMGLNLAIRRVILSTTHKFDGTKMTRIPIAQIKQIVGRAGRYRVASDSQYTDTEPAESVGLVSVMNSRDKGHVHRCLEMDSPLLHKALILPSDDVIKRYASGFPRTMSLSTILRTMSHDVSTMALGPHYKLCSMENMIEVCELFDNIPNLLIDEKLILAKAPVSLRFSLVKQAFQEFCLTIARSKSMSFLDMKEDGLKFLFDSLNFKTADVRAVSDSLESLSKVLELYLWLSYRFPSVFLDREGVMQLKQNAGQRINGLITADLSRLVKDYKRQNKEKKPYR